MFASYKGGLPCPAVWIRKVIAERWSCRPIDVPMGIEADMDLEIILELDLMEIEAQFQKHQQSRPQW
jgi:hypothetical protein